MDTYGQLAQCNTLSMAASYQQPSLKIRLDTAVKDAEERLADAKEAQAIFERNPDLEKLLDIMQKGRF